MGRRRFEAPNLHEAILSLWQIAATSEVTHI